MVWEILSPESHNDTGVLRPCVFFFLNFWILFYFFIQQVLISHPLYTHQCIHVNPNRPIHHTTTHTPCRFLPLVSIHLFSTSVSQFLPCRLVHLYHFSRFHIYALIYDICFSLSDLLHSVWQSLDSSTSLQMAHSRSFLWLNVVHCTYVPHMVHCIYVPHLPHLFVCRWAFRLLPWPGYCK